ncbi:MAG: autotransporter-associated beta strand repeat-containing protein [Sphingopyxis sp.]|uniref:autotransporter-associated beta strand repeat-containing protein n=1 Tax=Sphingopyxis sp. TaxID=1908224 RepID=UPI002ABB7167|nr:autotransporter-associated beta strand repeat-containing protein [Sphingopyxis sp.]MDZ3832509.1 autotransporter-associated beta strand repeat-containing protein [Sphingopyxis sp.]
MTSAAALVAAASFHPSTAWAQENVWQGDADQDWYKDENWSEGVHPHNGPTGDGFHVIIDAEGPQSPVIEFFSNPDRLAESARITIGSTGNGELTVRNGGSYSGGGSGRGRLRIGEQAGSRGLLTVSGDGSNFRLDNGGSPVEIGRYGEGSLVIDGGATFESTDTLIGSYAGSEGHVTVSGSNSTWAMLQDDPAYGSVMIVGSAGNGSLTIENGGSVLGAGPSTVYVGREGGGEGTVTVTGANSYLRSGTFFIGGDGAIRRSGTGTLAISDGGKVDSLSTNIGMWGIGAASVSGVGTSWNIDGMIRVGIYNAGTLAITDGAVVTATTGLLGESAGGTGTALVDGAQSQWNISGDLKVGGRSSSFTEASEGSLTVSDGGHVAVGRTLQIAELGVSTGTVYIGGDTAPAAAGTVSADEILFGQGDGTLVFNHTGTAHLFDTSLRSVADGQGSLSHRAGTTVLTGDSSGFSGATQVSGGTVLLTGVLGGSVSLDSLGPDLAGLGGTGRLTGDLTVTSGLLRPGLEQGTLTIDGNLTLGSGATLRYDLGAPSGTPGVDSDLLVVGGDLVLDGTLEVTDVGGFGEGLYRLIDYGGALTDNGLAIGSRLPTGYDDTNLTVQTAIAGEINLLVGESNDPGGDPGAFQFWNGTQTTPNGSIAGGAGTWSATGTNWTNADGSQSGVYDPDAMLIFAGTPGYTVTVDGSEGPITTSGMQFAVPDYTIAGDAIALDGAVTIRVGDGTAAGAAYTAHIDSDLTGWGMLIKDDLGTLVLTGEGNSYRGGTRVIAGVLVGNGNSLPGDIVNQSIVEFSEDTASVYMGNMIGTGAVTKTGAGETTFAGANSYTGGTFIQDGALIGHTVSLQGEIEIGTHGKMIFDQDADGVFSGNITGQGRLEKHGSGLVHLDGVTSHTGGTELTEGALSGTTDSLQGEIVMMDGTMLVFDQEADGRFAGILGGNRAILVKTGLGTVTMTGDNSFFTGDVQVLNGRLLTETVISPRSFVIGSPGHLKGTANTLGGDIAANGTLTITEDNDATYAGRLSGNGGGLFIKDGDGILRLTGDNSFAGRTDIREGALHGNTQSLTGSVYNMSEDTALIFNQSGDGTFAGEILGFGTLHKAGAGELHLTGANYYTGSTVIHEGFLRGDTNSLRGDIETEFSSDIIVIFDQDSNGTYFGDISGGGRLRKEGEGLVQLVGTNTYDGGTQVIAGTLSGTTDSLQGGIGISGNATLLFDQDSNGSFDGELAGSGNLAKAGEGVLTVTGQANSYDSFLGEVQVRNGTLVAEAAIGRGGFVVRSPGHLKGTADTLVGDIAANGTLTITGNDDATYAGRLSGNGGGLFIKEGDGILRLTGVNSFAGRTDIREGALHGNTQSLTGSMITMLEDTALIFSQSGNGSFSGQILGFGMLHKVGTGELHLTGSNNYTGGTVIHEGGLRGDTDSLHGNIDTGLSASNNLIFDQDSNGTFAGSVSGDGRLIKDGTGEVYLAGTTSHTGGTHILGGTLSGTTDNLRDFIVVYDNGRLEFDQDSNGSFDGELRGTGSLIKDGTGAVTLTGDASNFTGQTDILAGVLAVNGSLGGNITVSGGALNGTGTFGNVTTGQGGTFAPGNSIGQSNAASVTFEAGSVFEVELNDGGFVPGVNHDAIHVTGSATLIGGTVHVTPDNGTDTGETYLPGTYTILAADGGVSGAFDGVTDDYVFLDFALDYDPSAVYLISNRIAHFSDVALTANQAGIAATLDALDGGNDIVSALLGQTDEGAARHALDSLTGELHASLTATLVEQSRVTRDAAFARGNRISRREGVELWIEGLAGNQRTDGTANTAALKNNRYGFLLGADTNIGSNLRVGAFAGYTDSDVRATDRGSTASLGSTHLGAYGAGQWGGFGLQVGADISWHDIDASRQVNFPGYSDSLESAYSARTGQLYGRMSYALSAGSVTFTPFGEIAHVWHSSERFAETGGPAALDAEKVDTSVTFSTLGLRMGTEIDLGQSRAEFGAEIGWRHAFDQPEASVQALRAGGAPFAVAGAPIAENALSLGLGGRLALSDRASLSFGYNADLANQYENHAFRAGISFAF